MNEMKAAIEKRIAALAQQQAQAVAQVNMLAGGIYELQQLLSGFDKEPETVIVNKVEGHGLSEKALIDTVHAGLLQKQRRNGTAA